MWWSKVWDRAPTAKKRRPGTGVVQSRLGRKNTLPPSFLRPSDSRRITLGKNHLPTGTGTFLFRALLCLSPKLRSRNSSQARTLFSRLERAEGSGLFFWRDRLLLQSTVIISLMVSAWWCMCVIPGFGGGSHRVLMKPRTVCYPGRSCHCRLHAELSKTPKLLNQTVNEFLEIPISTVIICIYFAF